jgi:hypothetical protein
MTAQEVERLRREHEGRVWRAFLWSYGLCLCAVIPPLFSTLGIFKPQAEPLGQWFARSGAMMTVIAVFAQFKAASIATMIQGRAFGESWAFYRKYKRRQTIVAVLSLVLVVIGTIVWGIWGFAIPASPRRMTRPEGQFCTPAVPRLRSGPTRRPSSQSTAAQRHRVHSYHAEEVTSSRSSP